LQTAHEQTPLSNDTIDSVLRHGKQVGLRMYQHPLVQHLQRN